MSYNWSTNPTAYKLKRKNPLHSTPTQLHPLQNPNKTPTTTDPLSTIFDPLSTPTTTPTYPPWSLTKSQILSKFTTKEKLSITTSIFVEVPEKTLNRLEQLDLDSGSKQFYGGLSQEEYVNKINQLKEQLNSAWNLDSRVNALKIAIQCCKLLQETNVIGFYPSKFVLVTDILDIFGGLVFERLMGKSGTPEVSRETGKNWFFKIGSIRELLPRLLLELALLKSYKFTTTPSYDRILLRILNSIWGIADPVVAIYLRCYLCRVAMDLIPDNREIYLKCFQDLLLLHDQVLDNFRNNNKLVEGKVSMEKYFSVLSPGVDYILQCVVCRGEHLMYTMQLLEGVPVFWKSILLSSLLSTFPPDFIALHALEILEMIQTLDLNLSELLTSFGLCLIITQSKAKEIWPKVNKVMRKLRENYLQVAAVWVEFVVANFGNEVISNFLDDVVCHVSFENQGKLINLVEKLVQRGDVEGLLKMNNFNKILTNLAPENLKMVLEQWNKVETDLSDTVLISTLMWISVSLHDSVDPLTPPDEILQISHCISTFISRVFLKDDENLLNFYDTCRGAFPNLDQVQQQLIHSVLKLGMMKSYQIRQHTKRSRSFLSAIVAFCFITIPSLESNQLKLYLLTAQVAIANQCVSQADACCQMIINLMREEKSNEFVFAFLSTIISMPDNNDSVLYLMRAFLTIEWDCFVYLKTLSILNCFAQERYPYCFNCETNLELYGNSKDFINEVDNIASGVLYRLLNSLRSLPIKTQNSIKNALFLELKNCNTEKMQNLINYLQ